jgi:hypothetical protein
MATSYAVVLWAVAAFAAEEIEPAENSDETAAETERVYLAIRTDGKPGAGTESDPFDASTAAKFDALMMRFAHAHFGSYANGEFVHAKPIAIHLGRGIFETAALSDYGPHIGGPFATQHWLGKGWSLRGAGMHETEIRNVNPSSGGVWMFNSMGGTWGGPETGEITIADLTLNPQKSVHEDSRQYEAVITSADGRTTTARRENHGWRVGTRIEITGENYNGPNGSWDGGAWKLITAVTPDTFSWDSKNTLTGAVTVRRVGEWNGTRINGALNRVERVRVIDAGANSLAETWPLWVGGDDLIIDGCVVERCSGIMSAIGALPGKNRTIRNCLVDGEGCAAVLAITAVEHAEKNTIRNVTHAIYADTFSSTTPIHIRNNEIENASGGAILVRPHDHTSNIIVSGNRVRGGPSEVAIWIDPLANWTENEWRNAKGEKIWLQNIVISHNDLDEKRIEVAQARDVTIIDNVAGFGVFYRMAEPPVVSGNKTPAGEVPLGLGRSFVNESQPTVPEQSPDTR